jgi:hypothetical protein
VRGFQEQLERIERMAESNPLSKWFTEGAARGVDSIKNELAGAINQVNDLEKRRRDLEFEIGDAIRSQKSDMQDIVGISADIERARKDAFPKPFFEQWPAKPDSKPKGGGGRRDSFDMGKESRDAWAALLAENEARYINVPDPLFDEGGDGSILDAVLGNARDTDASKAAAGLAQMRDDAQSFADALESVANAADLVSQSMPEMGAALAEVQAITANVVDGKM